MRTTLATLWTLTLATAAFAQTNTVFQPKRMRDYNDRSPDGRCILRVRVDDEIDVELRGDRVLLRTIAGRPGSDEGSECSQSLPSGGFTRFQFKGIDGRGEVRMVQEPRLGNQWTAIVAIRDKKGGDEGYTFELSWNSTGSSMPVTTPSPMTGGGILPNLSNRPSQTNFNPFDETLSGSGTIRIGNQDYQVRRARVNLRSNGDAELVLYANEVHTLTGRWTANGDSADISINNVGNSSASARGRVYSRNGRFDRLELDGDAQRYGTRFQVNFAR